MASSRKRPGGGVQLSPPDVQYFNEIKNSVGKDPLVRVDPLNQMPDGITVVTLNVQGTRKAKALATLLAPSRSFGNIRVIVKVKTDGGKLVKPLQRSFSPEEIAGLYRVAFGSNRLFESAVTRKIFGGTFVYPVFKKRIVQFFNDDLSDFYGNYNNVAAFVFRDVLSNSISGTPIQFSTAIKKKC